MAVEVKIEGKNEELKRLGFVKVATLQALLFASYLYEYAKENAGPLRSSVGTVEGVVTSVIGPVYKKFKGVPGYLLVFLDNKVDEATYKFDDHAPPIAKKVVRQIQGLIQNASLKAQKLVDEAHNGGPRAALHYAAAEYKLFLLNQTGKMWTRLNRVPLIQTKAEMAVSTASRWSEKYNCVVKDMTHKGFTCFGWLPLAPVDQIANAFKKGETAKKDNLDASSAHTSDSDSD